KLLPSFVPFLRLRCCLRLCAANGNRTAFTGTGIGSRALAATWEPRFVAETAVRADILEAFDIIHVDTLEVTFNDVVGADDIANAHFFGFGQIFYARRRFYLSRRQNVFCDFRPDAKNICQPDLDLLFTRNNNTSNTSHDY